MAHRSDQDRIEKTHNLPRFFVEQQPGEKVIAVGAQLLTDGEPIEVIP